VDTGSAMRARKRTTNRPARRAGKAWRAVWARGVCLVWTGCRVVWGASLLIALVALEVVACACATALLAIAEGIVTGSTRGMVWWCRIPDRDVEGEREEGR
jgi:hypothetical protein